MHNFRDEKHFSIFPTFVSTSSNCKCVECLICTISYIQWLAAYLIKGQHLFNTNLQVNLNIQMFYMLQCGMVWPGIPECRQLIAAFQWIWSVFYAWNIQLLPTFKTHHQYLNSQNTSIVLYCFSAFTKKWSLQHNTQINPTLLRNCIWFMNPSTNTIAHKPTALIYLRLTLRVRQMQS